MTPRSFQRPPRPSLRPLPRGGFREENPLLGVRRVDNIHIWCAATPLSNGLYVMTCFPEGLNNNSVAALIGKKPHAQRLSEGEPFDGERMVSSRATASAA